MLIFHRHQTYAFTALCSFFIFTIHAGACTPKASVVGESIWAMADKIKAVTCGGGSNLIAQMDIPLTITNPGLYCLCESITSEATDPTPITINSNDVVLNLNQYTITKEFPTDGTGRNAIFVESTNNVMIANGCIQGISSALPQSGTLRLLSLSSVNGAIVQNIVFCRDTTVDTGVVAAAEANLCSQCVFYRCIAFKTGNVIPSFFISERDQVIFRECDAIEGENCFHTEQSEHVQFFDCNGMGLGGISATFSWGLSCQDLLFKDCCAINSLRGSRGLLGSLCEDITLDSCISQAITGTTIFSLSATHTAVLFSNCIAQGALSGTGFFIDSANTGAGTIIGCKSVNNAVGFEDEAGTFDLFNNYAGGNSSADFGPGIPAASIRSIATISNGSTNFWHNLMP